MNTHTSDNYDLIDTGAAARKLEEGQNVKQVMVDDIDIAVGQSEHEGRVGRGSRKPHLIVSKTEKKKPEGIW